MWHVLRFSSLRCRLLFSPEKILFFHFITLTEPLPCVFVFRHSACKPKRKLWWQKKTIIKISLRKCFSRVIVLFLYQINTACPSHTLFVWVCPRIVQKRDNRSQSTITHTIINALIRSFIFSMLCFCFACTSETSKSSKWKMGSVCLPELSQEHIKLFSCCCTPISHTSLFFSLYPCVIYHGPIYFC